jgi:hypothetical protein
MFHRRITVKQPDGRPRSHSRASWACQTTLTTPLPGAPSFAHPILRLVDTLDMVTTDLAIRR